jgi:hypothetical protein
MSLLPPRARFSLLLPFALAAPISAQQLIGYVNTRDASVTGASDVMDNHFVLTGSVSVTAKDHTAPVTLSRGGTVNVCQTSVLHLTESREMTVAAPLLFSLDRGAVEIQMNAAASDAIMTPDLRFTVRNAGPLDLRLRVSRNGDTCVENRGPGAPTLAVSDPFGESMYEVPGGRHVLFEHGSVHEVVDHETTPCGCPDEKGESLADAMLNAPVATPAPKPAPPAPTTPAAAVPTPVPPAPVQAPPVVVVQAPAPPPASAPPPAPAPPAMKAPEPAVVATPPPVQLATVVVQAAPPVPQVAAAVVAPPPATTKPAPPPAPAASAPVVVVQSPAPPSPSTAPAVTPPVEQAVAAPTEQSVEQAAAVAAARAAALHPFPAAISEELAPVPEAAPAAPGTVPAQITDSLSYVAPANSLSSGAAAAEEKKAGSEGSASAPGQATTGTAQSAPSHGFFHALGRFFRKVFGGS